MLQLPVGEVEVLANADSIAIRAAEYWLAAADSVAGDTPIRICLSGGSTPRRLYQLLGKPPWRDALPWPRLHFFWGDERCVPQDHADSNYRMVREALLDQVPIPAENIHPVPVWLASPELVAQAYEAELGRCYGADRLQVERPLFHLTLLGVGDDGHTASLFPGIAALAEKQRWTAAVVGAKPEARVSLTYPALNASGEVLVLASGPAKRQVLQRVAAGEPLPIAGIRPVFGPLRWLLDAAAAG